MVRTAPQEERAGAPWGFGRAYGARFNLTNGCGMHTMPYNAPYSGYGLQALLLTELVQLAKVACGAFADLCSASGGKRCDFCRLPRRFKWR